MKTTPIFKILSAAVLLAVVFYFVVQGYRYFSDPINTTYVYASREWDAIETEGYLVREEETFHSGLTTLHHKVEHHCQQHGSGEDFEDRRGFHCLLLTLPPPPLRKSPVWAQWWRWRACR